jgi:BirA family transcriptional regulator, biotin operon repressor / biotin---[acetyl-CoA-carboxylase] ligase
MGSDLGEHVTAGAGRFRAPIHLTSTDSTNREVLDAARMGALEGHVVIADFQEAGRGRRGRTWNAPVGGALLCSILFQPRLDPDDLHLVPTAVALAARAAIAQVTGVLVDLKWPNDLLVGGDKLGGILTEIETGTPPAVVVGIGINVSFPDGFAPDEPAPGALRPGTIAEASGVVIAPAVLVEPMLSGLEDRYASLDRAPGRAALRAEYAAACVTLGATVRIETAGAPITGVARAIASDGRLVIDSDRGEVAIEAGDVVHLRTITDGANDPPEASSARGRQ